MILGPDSLTDAELLTLLIREGTDSLSAYQLASRMLDSFGGSLTELAHADLKRLRMIEGCGTKRAVMLVTAGELSRRIAKQEALSVTAISSNDDVVKLFAPLARLHHEEFWVLYLTSAGRIIDRGRASQGGVSGTVVDYRLIVKRAIELLASSLILVHNHPSGCASPSEEDFQVTEKIVKAAALFDIRVMDHIIISSESHFSFLQKGLMPDPNDD